MDDCLVSWIKGFALYIRDIHDRDFDVNSEPTDWKMAHWTGVDDATTWSWIEDFNSGKHWQFGALPPTRRAQEIVAKLNSEGYKFVVITCASSDPVSINLRRANLHNLFGDAIQELVCLGLKDSKLPHLQKYNPTVWIEDKVKNALDGVSVGHRGILMDQLHNREMHTPELIRVQNWHDIYRNVKAHFENPVGWQFAGGFNGA